MNQEAREIKNEEKRGPATQPHSLPWSKSESKITEVRKGKNQEAKCGWGNLT